MNCKSWLVLSVFLLAAPMALAAPPRLELLATPEGRALATEVARKTPPLPVRPPPGRGARVLGKIASANGPLVPIVLLSSFNDVTPAAASTVAAFSDHLFLDDGVFQVNAKNSVREYLREVSYGALDFRGDPNFDDVVESVRNWQILSHSQSYYNTTDHYAELAADAITAHNDAGVDFSRFDGDGDGYVDALIVVHSGYGVEDTGDAAHLPSHYAAFSPPIAVDGVLISDYVLVPELRSYKSSPDGLSETGVWIHELGHLFGLPELYDTTFQSFGIGSFGVMGYGLWGVQLDWSNPLLARPANRPSHPSAWSKMMLGWLTPVPIWADVNDYPLLRVEKTGVALQIFADSSGREYFLVESRQSYNFDAYWPGGGARLPFNWEQGGLLVWHIDERVIDAGGGFPNNDYTHKGVNLECSNNADGGLSDLDVPPPGPGYNDYGNTLHFYIGQEGFGEIGHPPSTAYDGSVTGVVARNDLAAGVVTIGANPILVDVSAGTVVLAPKSLQVESTPEGFLLTFTPSPAGDVVAYHLYIDAQAEPTEILSADPPHEFLASGLDPCADHDFLLTAVDADGHESLGIAASTLALDCGGGGGGGGGGGCFLGLLLR